MQRGGDTVIGAMGFADACVIVYVAEALIVRTLLGLQMRPALQPAACCPGEHQRICRFQNDGAIIT